MGRLYLVSVTVSFIEPIMVWAESGREARRLAIRETELMHPIEDESLVGIAAELPNEDDVVEEGTVLSENDLEMAGVPKEEWPRYLASRKESGSE